MKRSIADYFGGSPTKKAKLVEGSSATHPAPIVPTSPPKGAPEPVNKPILSEEPASSSNDLSPEQLATIELNRKKALAKKLFNKITDPSWREALAPGTLRDKVDFNAHLFFSFSVIIHPLPISDSHF